MGICGKTLLAFLAIACSCLHLQAQNVEGQIIAAQYGTWTVQGFAPNTYSFSPTACRVAGGNSFFFPFSAGTPIRIFDGSPALSETVVVTSYVDTNSSCAISIAPVNNHQLPWYIGSATGGLQEAINANLTTPAANTIVLTAAWYQSLAAVNTTAAAVIAAAKGSTQLGLVDVTTVPSTFYSWDGTQYVQIGNGGGAQTPATALPLCGTGGANGVRACTPGSDIVTPTVGNIAGQSGTTLALAANPTTCPTGQAPTGIIANGNSTDCQPIGTGTGNGTVSPGNPYQAGRYTSAGGNTIAPAPNIYTLDSTMTQAQINALFAGLTAGQDVVTIPPSVGWIPFLNPNGVEIVDERSGAMQLQIGGFGVSCDEQQFVVTLTQGSNQVNVGSSLTFATGVGKTMTFAVRSGYGYAATQSTWTATVTAFSATTFPYATLSANAPFNFSGYAQVGTLNTANLQTALNSVGYSYPLFIPAGCKMLTGPLQWNKAQSIIGQQMATAGFVGLPGQDIFVNPDASGQGSANGSGVRMQDFDLDLDGGVDASLGYISYNPAGTPTTIPPLYRPLMTHSQKANNPLAPGWITGGANGVAATTAGSAVICVPTALGKVPTVGQTIMFPYFATIFTATVNSNTGAGCATGFTGSTLSANVPAGDTAAQAEWFTGTAIQSTTTTIPTSITYPLTLTLTLPTGPIPGYESNFATSGHIKVCGIEADYMGAPGTYQYASPYQIVLRKGPATSAGCSGTTVIAPMNPCPAKNLFGSTSDQPWPVTPSINTGDSTPSGANWFPGQCGGNAAISFPEANGNIYVGVGLVNSFLEHLEFDITPNTPANANSTIAALYQGNNASYGTDFGGWKINGTEYGFWQGPASAGQHGVAAAGPTGAENHIHNFSIRAAYPMGLVDYQSGTVDGVYEYSTEYSPYDGTAIGNATCFFEGYTLDERAGTVVTNVAGNAHSGWGCEPENGSDIENPAYVELDGIDQTFTGYVFEGDFSIFGGSNQTFTGGSLAAPAIDYGTSNHFVGIPGLNTQFIYNTWPNGFIEWGTNVDCSSVAGGQSGPLIACSPGLTQPYSGRSYHASEFGTIVQNPQGGVISPGEWNTAGNLDTSPMTAANVQDTTEPNWGRYAACNLGGGAQCSPAHWDGFAGYIYVGNFNRIAPVLYTLSANFKTAAAASQFTLTISVADSGSGQCGANAGTLLTQNITTSTAWTPWTGTVDFTGKSGCVVVATFGSGTTTDQLRVGKFEFIPKQKKIFLQVATFTIGASCPTDSVNGAFLGSDTNYAYLCEGGVIVGASFSGLNGTLTATDVPVATGPNALGNSNFKDAAGVGSYNGTQFTVNTPGPGSTSWSINSGTPPALPAFSAGWRAPATGGTPYLFQPPPTITAGYLVAGTPAAGSDGRLTSLVTPQEIEFTIGGSGDFGFLTSPAVIAQAAALNSGHFVKLIVTNSTSGTCTTAPTFNIFDTSSHTGTAVTGSTTQQAYGSASGTSTAQTLAITAGDLYGVVMTNSGNTCNGQFSVYATVEEP